MKDQALPKLTLSDLSAQFFFILASLCVVEPHDQEFENSNPAKW